MESAEIEILKKFYKAINQNDIESAMQFFSPQIERIEESKDNAPARTYCGSEKVRAHVLEGRGTWAEGSCEPKRFSVKNDKVIVFVHVRVRLKDKTDWVDGRLADVFTFKDNSIIQWRTFWKGQEAIEWVGVKD